MSRKRKHPIAFMSYVRFEDEHADGRLTEFRERLSAEVRVQTGEEFIIFQDRNDIKWGQNWKERIEESLDKVTFLIPIITPSFFNSPPCRGELEKFLEREKKLRRNDLILPVYYVDCPLLNEEAKRATDELAEVVAVRQYADWRPLRFEYFTSPQVGKRLAELSVQIREALERTAGPGRRRASGKPTAKRATRAKASEPSESQAEGAESVSDMAEPARAPTTKTEPPTLVVDPMHRGDHTTITAAIEDASAGD
ncbi:MAG: TIR domain-containing protein, partial [Chloroflexi bacterium]|nr:TIR domain-containing protein [Chloroflexota bacterium]